MAKRDPSFWQRVKMSLAYLRRGWPAVAPSSVKQPPFLWPAWRSGQPQWSIVNVDNYITEGYEANSVIYSAIMYKVRAGTSAPLRAYKGDEFQHEPLPRDNPLSRLVSRPNPYQAFEEFHSVNIVYLNLLGNVFIYMDRRNRAAGLPEAMYSLRPDRIAIIPDGRRGIKGYVYVPEGMTWQDGIPILPQDMMHVRLPNPGDPLEGLGWGLSPVAAMARSADVDNAATTFLKLFFEKGAMIPGVLSFDVPMDDETVSRARERWMEIYGGHENWTDIAVLDQGGKYQRIGLAFNEMGFEAIDSRNEARILGPFGVPAILIGSRYGLDRGTYSNTEQLRRMFWEDTMLPEMRLFEVEYQYFLNQGDGAFVMFDTSGVPALKVDIAGLIESAQKLWSMGVPLNIATATVGLELADEVEGGDVGWLPLSVQTVEQKLKPPEPIPAALLPGMARGASGSTARPEPEEPDESGGPGATEDEEEERTEAAGPGPGETKDGLTADLRAAVGRALDALSAAWVPQFGAAAKQALEHDRRAVLALVGDARDAAKAARATLDHAALSASVSAYYDTAAPDAWAREYAGRWHELCMACGEQAAVLLGVPAFKSPPSLPTLTCARFKAGILALAAQAGGDGWTVPELQKRIGEQFDAWAATDWSGETAAMAQSAANHALDMLLTEHGFKAGPLPLGVPAPNVHRPEPGGPCPLCGHPDTDRYDDHGGLCVCRSCKCTFDPGAYRPGDMPVKATRQVDEETRKRRERFRRRALEQIGAALGNADGLARVRDISDEAWQAAQESDGAA